MARIVITGANRGIGLALARWYHAAGHDVIRLLRGDDAPENARISTVISCDVGSDASVAAMAQAITDAPIDLLVNNAGIGGPKQQSTFAMDFDGFLNVLNINTLGPLRVTQALLPQLRAASGAKVAVISSTMGSLHNPARGSLAYRSSKAAVNKLVQTIAADLKDEGIAIVALHPGWVRTDMGGSSADISVDESVDGIANVLDQLTIADTGHFLQWNGEEVAW